MNAEAIKEISQLAIDAAGANRIDANTPAIVLGEKVVSLEHLQAARSRYRGEFKTSVLSEFAIYLKANAGGIGFIDPKSCYAKTYLNLGTAETPGHADWTATLELEPTAAYAALLAVNGKQHSQKALVEWIEDWSGNLRGTDNSPISNAVAAIRELTISAKSDVTHTDKDFGAKRSALEEIEAKSTARIPTHINFMCEPYLGFQQRDFILRLSIITGEKPALTLRIVSHEANVEDIAKEFKSALMEAVGTAAHMVIGSFSP